MDRHYYQRGYTIGKRICRFPRLGIVGDYRLALEEIKGRFSDERFAEFRQGMFDAIAKE